MELRREVLLTLGGLVALNLLLAFGSIGLFVRMGPAIKRILHENMSSIVAAEDILAELADAGGETLPGNAQDRVGESLQRASRNVTEDEERLVLSSLERHLTSAMNGDHHARRQVVIDLKQLIRINRDAMRRVDDEAQRLGSAGAWAAVLLGFFSFLFGFFVVVRLRQRFIKPLVDLYEVVDSANRGDRLRRCRASAAPREVVQVMAAVNRLLDERLQRNHAESAEDARTMETFQAPRKP